jgi:hypothetical protein
LRWNYYCIGPFLSFLSFPQAQDDVALVFLSFSSPQAQAQDVFALVIFFLSPFLVLALVLFSLSFP